MDWFNTLNKTFKLSVTALLALLIVSCIILFTSTTLKVLGIIYIVHLSILYAEVVKNILKS